jgi:hypothetical protein
MDTVHFILSLMIIFVILFNLYLYYNHPTPVFEGLGQPGLQWWYFGNINGDGYCEDNRQWNNNAVSNWVNWAKGNQVRRSGTTTDVSRLAGITQNYVIGNNTKPDNRFSVLVQGYFVPNVSGVWNFWTNSDDCSYVWVNVPFNNITTGNATVNNGGKHGMAQRSGGINLVANQSYPITILFGEQGGAYEMNVQFQPPGGAWTSNGSGLFFINPLPSLDTTIYASAQTSGTK